MEEKPSNLSLINMILEDEEEKTLEEEEVIHLLLERKVSRNTSVIGEDQLTVGAKMADGIAKFVGSWTFILIFMGCLCLWILVNLLLVTRAFDPYPFILLNLTLSTYAAFSTPLILMAQNRQSMKDRAVAQNDYQVNLKSEVEIADLHRKMDSLTEALTMQTRLVNALVAARHKELSATVRAMEINRMQAVPVPVANGNHNGHHIE